MLRNNSEMPKTLKNKMVSGNPRPYSIYTGYPGGNVPDFGRMFLKLKYTDITKTPICKVERLRR